MNGKDEKIKKKMGRPKKEVSTARVNRHIRMSDSEWKKVQDMFDYLREGKEKNIDVLIKALYRMQRSKNRNEQKKAKAKELEENT